MKNEQEITKLKIELNQINGSYSLPNLLCEYIFFSGPNNFELIIKINQKESNNFFLLYSSDSLNFTEIINSSTILNLDMKPNNLNTLLFYSLKSFDESPFKITYKPNFWYEAVKVTGYILLAFIVIILFAIVFIIIYMRRNLSLFKKKKKEKKISYEKSKGEEIALMKKTSNETNVTGPSIIKNFTPSTPAKFLEKENFSYNNNAVSLCLYAGAKTHHIFPRHCFPAGCCRNKMDGDAHHQAWRTRGDKHRLR
jgi:hypothetical protein